MWGLSLSISNKHPGNPDAVSPMDQILSSKNLTQLFYLSQKDEEQPKGVRVTSPRSHNKMTTNSNHIHIK